MGFPRLLKKRRMRENRSPMKYIRVWEVWALLNGISCAESHNCTGDELHYMEHLATMTYSRIFRKHTIFDKNERNCFLFLYPEKPLSLLQQSVKILTIRHTNFDGFLECKRCPLLSNHDCGWWLAPTYSQFVPLTKEFSLWKSYMKKERDKWEAKIKKGAFLCIVVQWSQSKMMKLVANQARRACHM